MLSDKNTDSDHNQADAIVKEGNKEIPIQITRVLNPEKGKHLNTIDRAARDHNILSFSIDAPLRKNQNNGNPNWIQPKNEPYYEVNAMPVAYILEEKLEGFVKRTHESYLKKEKKAEKLPPLEANEEAWLLISVDILMTLRDELDTLKALINKSLKKRKIIDTYYGKVFVYLNVAHNFSEYPDYDFLICIR